MIVGAFLAEAAAAVDNKLNVSGGVLLRFAVEEDRLAQFLLVVLTQAETGSPDRRVEVEIRPPTDEESLTIEFELPEAATTAELGFAIFPVEVTLPVNGRWVLMVTGGAGMISLPLIVSG
ncbi:MULTISPECIES: hypothetical protein [Mycobacterium]|uniref:Uncharacterized protein n=1 Tax=Mycobacterium kiyosense TaxID=2871094 RepID=A0A9P3QCP4_9MYCO|nr:MULTISPECIES: hypothetical protein [Mycobacterium]BDB45625.1 hypothetical protein IWGMT90018_60710 [Mycobacterium kiyosense]BDE11242.1 hypothetical protein MKCMC460_01020 [Mycobacterium sp. 20KCMC460]GLB85789.1 hypothetical protein SRL2020028_50450 [Mycobacterium kiyosense]GLB92471.1 hypothetical protein SRL2020130_52880 [Mycobacterium kiyosense]GLB96848.1 hypothetical protein SRL2020226_36240 [Mycobacterium kiyosense]